MTKSIDAGIETIRALRGLGELVRHVLKPLPTGGAATGTVPSAPVTQARFRATCTLCGWQDHTPDSTREEAATHLAWHAYTCPQQAPGDKCHYCNGYGSKVWDPIEGYPEKCLSCDGTGRLDRLAPAEPVTIPGVVA